MGCWPLNEGAGSTVSDGSSNNNTGTVSGATWAATDAGTALSFSGATDQSVSVANSATLSSANALTLEAWIRPTSVGTDATVDRIIDKDYNAEYGLGLGTGGGRLCVKLRGNDNCDGTVVANAWQHVGMTWTTGTGPIMYINGQNVGVGSNTNGPITASAQNLLLGNSTTSPSATTRFKGDLRAVRIYNRAKTAAEMCGAAGRTWSGTACQ